MNNIKRPVLKLNFAAPDSASITKSRTTKEKSIPATEIFAAATEKDKIPTGTTINMEPVTSSENQAPEHDRKQQAQKPKDKPKLLLTPDEYASMLGFFKETYPKCFTEPPTLLTIDIHKTMFELHKGKFSRIRLRKFLTIYCRNKVYRQAHTIGVPRVDLSGNIVSSVTEEQMLRKRWKKAAKAKAGLKNSKPHKEETAPEAGIA